MFCFHQKKTAAETKRIICETYGKDVIAASTCGKWFERFRSGDFDTNDKERPGRPRNLKDNRLEELLREDNTQSTRELAEQLGIYHKTVVI